LFGKNRKEGEEKKWGRCKFSRCDYAQKAGSLNGEGGSTSILELGIGLKRENESKQFRN